MEIKVSDLTNLSLMTVSCILLIKTTQYQSDKHSCQPQDSGIQITDVQDVISSDLCQIHGISIYHYKQFRDINVTQISNTAYKRWYYMTKSKVHHSRESDGLFVGCIV